MKRRTWEERMALPLDGNPDILFYTKGKQLLASGYERIVLGGRGPYIEFTSDQICHDNIYIPDKARHKLTNDMSYYHEYRSKDKHYVKLYYQRIEVMYADYKVGLWYVSPSDLVTEELEELVLPIYADPAPPEPEDSGPTLFDVL